MSSPYRARTWHRGSDWSRDRHALADAQEELNALRFDDGAELFPELMPDGLVGPHTRAAVRALPPAKRVLLSAITTMTITLNGLWLENVQ